jgi:hypothetical protein
MRIKTATFLDLTGDPNDFALRAKYQYKCYSRHSGWATGYFIYRQKQEGSLFFESFRKDTGPTSLLLHR